MGGQMREIGIGLLGLGTVGQAVVKILKEHGEGFSSSLGVNLVLRKIAVRDLKKNRGNHIVSKELLTTSINEVVHHPNIDLVVELMGGITDAKFAVLEALDHEKSVVTANKALIAQYGQEIFELAQKKKCDFLYEASVGGGIPILRVLRESFMGNKILSIKGIVNGTSNYILSKMTEAQQKGQLGLKFEEVLKEAQNKGYAEADPTMDIDGTDVVQKLGILASLAFGGWVDFRKIYKEGIKNLTMLDFAMADYFHYRIKLLAIAKPTEKGLDVRVHPTLLPKDKLLAEVDGVYNAIAFEGDSLGPGLLLGKGAGGGPTASVVVSDIVDIARNLLVTSESRVPILPISEFPMENLSLRTMDQLECRYYCRFIVIDRPGALAEITRIFANHHISIGSLLQKERSQLTPIPVVLLTHEAIEKNIISAIDEISKLDVVIEKPVILRIEE